MPLSIPFFECACALGRSREEVAANLAHGVSPLVPLSDAVPNRTVLFGAVAGELPAIADPEYDCRTNRLLLHVLNLARERFAEFVARHGAGRVAVVLGGSNTGVHEAMPLVGKWIDDGRRPDAMRFSLLELGTGAEFVARELGVAGPAYVVSTACSSAAKAFASARRLIEAGVVDAAIAGGADGRCNFALNGFAALGALSPRLCRPLADDRDGINLGEGAALFALERGDAPLRFVGAGESSDAVHPTAPDPEGRGAEAAMRGALADANLSPHDVSYVNLHGTGTPANDAMEMAAVRRIWPDARWGNGRADGGAGPLCESTKPLTGHCLGAAGAVEAAIVCLKLERREFAGAALSNSFAFGGANATVAFAR